MVDDKIKADDITPVVIENDKKYTFENLNKTKAIIAIIICVLLIIIAFLLKKPHVELIGDKVEKISYKSEFIDSGIVVKYYGKDITNKVVTIADINTSELGKYKIIYKIPYALGTYTYKRKAVVVDDMAPEITLTGDEEFKLSYNKGYNEPGYKATDNHDGDISDKVEIYEEIVNDDETDWHYKVSDTSGNSQEKIRKVYKVDEVKPVIE